MARKKKDPGGGTPATARLESLGLAFTLHPYDQDALDHNLSLGEAVALSLGIDSDRMFKTLIAVVDGSPVCGIVQVSRSLSLKAIARAAGGKRAEMANPQDAERWTGYITGGISPIGQAKDIPRFLDSGATAHVAVVVSAGKRGHQVELAPADLVSASGATLVDGLGA